MGGREGKGKEGKKEGWGGEGPPLFLDKSNPAYYNNTRNAPHTSGARRMTMIVTNVIHHFDKHLNPRLRYHGQNFICIPNFDDISINR